MANGRSFEGHLQCTGLHRQPAGPHGHSRKAFTSPGSSTGPATTKITSKSTWRNAYSVTRKSGTWVSLILQTGSNQEKINSRLSRMPNHPPISKQFDHILCNFFRMHIKDFALIVAPLFKLTRKDSGYKSGQLPEKALKAFCILQKQLTSEPVMAFPKSDRQYALITDAATGMADTPGGLGAILTQVDKEGNFHAISFASRQLKDHEVNYSPFLLEAAAAVWGMDFFNEYLKGKRFILYTDHKCNNCEEFKKLFLKLKEREEQCYQLKQQINFARQHRLHQINQIKSVDTKLKTGIAESLREPLMKTPFDQ
jgi:hypothetical protein